LRRPSATEGVYSLASWCEWNKSEAHKPRDLSHMRMWPDEVWEEDAFEITDYKKLFQIVSFLNVMNKRASLLFRGQGRDVRPLPALYRDTWSPSAKAMGEIALGEQREHYLGQLQEACGRVVPVLRTRGLPRYRPFQNYKQRPFAAWAVVQHYELWPTPLLDLTSSLRIAASFALGLSGSHRDAGAATGYLYAFAIQRIATDLMTVGSWKGDDPALIADSITVRLSAVCPPNAVRPHLQEGYLTGRASVQGVFAGEPSRLVPRLVGKFRLVDYRTRRKRFWSRDFPEHSRTSLLPPEEADDLLRELRAAVPYTLDAGGRVVVG